MSLGGTLWLAAAKQLLRTLDELGEHRLGVDLAERVLSSSESTFGPGAEISSSARFDLGRFLTEAGEYARARVVLERDIELRTGQHGPDAPGLARPLVALGILNRRDGELRTARTELLRALELREHAHGHDHPGVASAADSLGLVELESGRYADAERHLRHAFAVRSAELGPEHIDTTRTLNHLGMVTAAVGDHATALQMFEDAARLRALSLGRMHPLVASAVGNAGWTLVHLGRLREARERFCWSADITRAAVGERHPDMATELNNLGWVEHELGRYDEAAQHFRKALELRLELLSPNHPLVARSLHNLGVLELHRGRPEDAERHLRSALVRRRELLGRHHPETAETLTWLAEHRVRQARWEEALELVLEAQAADDEWTRQVLAVAPPSHRAAFLAGAYLRGMQLQALVIPKMSGDLRARQALLGFVLRRRAVGLETQLRQRLELLAGRATHRREELEELDRVRRQLGDRLLAGPRAAGQADRHREEVNRLASRNEALSASLARHLPELRVDLEVAAAGREAIAAVLPPDSVLVEYLLARRGGPRTHPPGRSHSGAELGYVALLLQAGRPDHVSLVDLGDAGRIDRLVREFRLGLTFELDSERAPYEPSAEPPRTWQESGAELAAAILTPVVAGCAGRRRLLVVPDGAISRVPLGALPCVDGSPAVSHFDITYLTTGRDAVRLAARGTRPSGPPLVVAAPNFELGAGTKRSEGDAQPAAVQAIRSGLGLFSPLPGTRDEGNAVAELLRTTPILGDDAVEARIKRTESPEILHVATHGFSLAARDVDFTGGLRSAALATGTSALPPERPDAPLLRSGLALAGANTWLRGETPPAEAEDGLLTAADVTTLNLVGTDLAVFSACQTGLGDLRAEEGLMGLRRALTLAGAASVVTSMWRVPDRETAELMQGFYARLLDGASRASALRDAQLEFVAKGKDPFDWGAFVLHGETGPLSSTRGS